MTNNHGTTKPQHNLSGPLDDGFYCLLCSNGRSYTGHIKQPAEPVDQVRNGEQIKKRLERYWI